MREIFGAGTIFAGTDFVINVFGDKFQPVGVFVAPPGAFILLGILIAVFLSATKKHATD